MEIKTIEEDIRHTQESTYNTFKYWGEMTTEEKLETLKNKQDEVIRALQNK